MLDCFFSGGMILVNTRELMYDAKNCLSSFSGKISILNCERTFHHISQSLMEVRINLENESC